MKCKINRNAAKELKKMLAREEESGKMLRVIVTNMHGDHAHYDIQFDHPTERDEIVHTDKEIDILLEKGQEYLDGVWIQFFHFPEEQWVITNPSMDREGHGHHH